MIREVGKALRPAGPFEIGPMGIRPMPMLPSFFTTSAS